MKAIDFSFVMVLVGIEATWYTWRLLKDPEYELAGPLGTIPQERNISLHKDKLSLYPIYH